VIVAITGASCAIYGIRALQFLRGRTDETCAPVEVHLIITRGGRETIREETDLSVAQVCGLADVVHKPGDLGAPVSSGSFVTRGCSSHLVASRRYPGSRTVTTTPWLSAPRETPLHSGHLRLMLDATAAGAIIAPPVPLFTFARKRLTRSLTTRWAGHWTCSG
jgi:4-hydroxy-3-polyprenylbenzoate decarboxylase